MSNTRIYVKTSVVYMLKHRCKLQHSVTLPKRKREIEYGIFSPLMRANQIKST